MELFTIGFTKKSAQTFFELIKAHDISMLIDIRLNNASQLASFSKGGDLDYFLSEICGCNYRYEPIFAPSKELMDGYKDKKISTAQFEDGYSSLMTNRGALLYFSENFLSENRICMLCSEDTPEHCHRRILSEMIVAKFHNVPLIHI